MSLLSRPQAEIVVARSKRTQERYPVRTSHLTGTSTQTSKPPLLLHHTDSVRIQVCRCSHPQYHERAHPVSNDDRNLAIAVTRYMNKFELESCHQPDFHQYFQQQRLEWAVSGVRVERLHYFRKNKDVVCRCSRPDHHGYRRVQNPKIQELCAKYFEDHKETTTCTREQWWAIDTNVQERAGLLAFSSRASTTPLGRASTPRRDSFEYDSPSMIDSLNKLQKQPVNLHKYYSQRSSNSHNQQPLQPSCIKRHIDQFSRESDEAEIPEDVWRVSRPSVYLGQDKTDSVLSTPLGSSVSAAPIKMMPKNSKQRPSTLDLESKTHNTNSPATAWHQDLAIDSSSSWLGRPTNKSTPPPPTFSLHHDADRIEPYTDIPGLEVSLSKNLRPSNSRLADMPGVHRGDNVAELPSPDMAVELDATPTQSVFISHHSPTLRELEGGSFEHVSELTDGQSPVRAIRPKSTTNSRNSTGQIHQSL